MKVCTDTSQVKADALVVLTNWGWRKKALTRAITACKMLEAVCVCAGKDLEEQLQLVSLPD